MTRIAWSIFATGLLAALSPVSAETRLVPSGEIVERLTDAVPTSGLLVAGLHWGKPARLFNVNDLWLRAAGSQPSKTVCVRVATRDGRYRALAAYTVPVGADDSARLIFKSKYSAQLQQMPAGDFAIKTVIADDCNDAANGTLMPASLGGVTAADPLVVLLNPSDADASAQIVAADGKLSLSGDPVPCRSVGSGVKIAYSHACELALTMPASAGRAKLNIALVEWTGGQRVRSYDIELPSR